MQPVAKCTLERFATFFAYQRNGFKLKEITPWFTCYQAGLPEPGFDGVSPRKGDHFVQVLFAMYPENQRLALLDLCTNPPAVPGCPSDAERLELAKEVYGGSPLGQSLTAVSLRGIKKDWWTASSRLHSSPAGAITAGRTMVESVSKTIISERGGTPDSSSKMGKLVDKAMEALGLKSGSGVNNAVNQLVSGALSISDGLASISNEAGDRHGQVGGATLDDATIAEVCVNAAGLLSLLLARLHLHGVLNQGATPEE